ncbi:MAG: acyltransferase [Coriobacteriales bacterium]|nr:acyltransferase [Coriobacteriales bacterium]
MSRERLYSLDFVRFVAAIMVVGVHALPSASSQPVFIAVAKPALIACNGIFFMLSGTLNVRVRERQSLPTYYFRKVRNVLVPFVLYVALITLWDTRDALPDLSKAAHDFVTSMLSNEMQGHLWFVRTLFGMLLAAPLLARMCAGANGGERRAFVVCLTLYMCVQFVCANLSVPYSWSYPLGGWIALFCLVPLLGEAVRRRSVPTWVVGGVVVAAWGALVLLKALGWSKLIHDPNPIYIIESAGIYVLLFRAGERLRPSRVVSIVARRQYGIYIIHIFVLWRVTRLFSLASMPILTFVLHTALAFALSFATAAGVDTLLIGPVQRLLDAAWSKVRNPRVTDSHAGS